MSVASGLLWCMQAGVPISEPEQALYPVHIDPLLWTEVHKFAASDGQENDRFGARLALDGNVLVAGAPKADGATTDVGGAYVFERQGSAWTEVQRLTASDEQENAWFGRSVAIAGDVVVAGAPGADGATTDAGGAYVFERQGTTWTEVQRLAASDEQENAWFGHSVALSVDLLVVGAARADGPVLSTGAAYVFERQGGTWTETQKLLASDAHGGDGFGTSVAVSGDVVMVGAPNASSQGAAYVFERQVGTWTELQKIFPSDGQEGDIFGSNVALSADRLVVGAPQHDAAGAESGAAYVFERQQDTWTEVDKLTASDGQPYNLFGESVAPSDDRLVVGAPWADATTPSSGAAYVFERQGSIWTELQKLSAADARQEDNFGYGVALSGEVVVVGAPAADAVVLGPGAAYVFALQASAGDACEAASDCVSGYCADSVCCEQACGDSAVDDCVACSVQAGSTEDGRCEPLADDTWCGTGRCEAGICEPVEAGGHCQQTQQCDSGHCVDEVCCQEPSCHPYRCSAGTGSCIQRCDNTSECVEGYRCTSDGVCEERTPVDDGACSCRLVAAPARASWWIPLTVLGLGAATRRRGRRP